jgi:hypothetical protein
LITLGLCGGIELYVVTNGEALLHCDQPQEFLCLTRNTYVPPGVRSHAVNEVLLGKEPRDVMSVQSSCDLLEVVTAACNSRWSCSEGERGGGGGGVAVVVVVSC